MGTPSQLRFTVLERRVRIDCDLPDVASVFRVVYAASLSPLPADEPHLDYRVGTRPDGQPTLHRDGELVARPTPPELLAPLFDDDLVVQLQLQRADLLFIHAAVLQHDRGALLLVGESGAGKSTLAWTLSHHGLRYLSDELAPIDVQRGCVRPFPRAVCLKAPPPGPYVLPTAVARSGALTYVPLAALPGGAGQDSCQLDTLVFLESKAPRGAARQAGLAEAVTRLYAQTLNALAHPGDGLDPAVEVCGRCRCYTLTVGEVEETVDLLLALLR